MSNDKKQPQPSRLIINGKPATEREYRHIFDTRTPATPRKDDRATKPLHSVVRSFELMR